MNAKGQYKICKVSTDDGHLKIAFKSKYDEEGNADILGTNIKSLMAGEYARRRVGEAIGTAVLSLGIGIFMMFSKKKRDQIAVEYFTDDSAPVVKKGSHNKTAPVRPSKVAMLQVKKKYGLALKADLKALSGKDIQEEPASK